MGLRRLFACFIVGGLISGVLALATAGAWAGAPALWTQAPTLGGRPGHDTGPDLAGRVTVLVMGLDRRPVESPNAPSRTDSILLCSVDVTGHTVSVLSIPRDLWVPIPLSSGVLEERINAAYFIGEQNAYPGGGAALARATIEYNLGVRVHHYILLDFQAFERFIDDIGGVDLNLASAIEDPAYPTEDYGAMAIRIPAGKQHLNGQRALWFARSRYQSSDFARMKRQQQLLLAVRDRLLQLDMLPKLPALWAEQGHWIQTDMSVTQVFDLARLTWGIPQERITARTLELGYVVRGAASGDPFVLFPDRARIAQLVGQLFPDTLSSAPLRLVPP